MSVAEERCEITDLVRSWCSHCREQAAPPARIESAPRDILAPERPGHGPFFTASFRSPCAECLDDMHEGDWICAVDDVGWCHKECWEAM